MEYPSNGEESRASIIATIERELHDSSLRTRDEAEEEIIDLTQEIELNPDNAVAYYFRGTAKVRWIESNTAIDEHRHLGGSIIIDSDTERLLGIGDSDPRYHSIHIYESAVKDFDNAIRLGAGDFSFEAHLNRGRAKDNAGDNPQPVIADFDTAIRLDPDNADAYYHRAVVKWRHEPFLDEKRKQDPLWSVCLGTEQDLETALNLAQREGDEILEENIEELFQEIEKHQQRLTAQQKPKGGMCGVVFLACVIVGILVLLDFIF